jgi:septal ring factor EnvC (AmiA/AmiB activator)
MTTLFGRITIGRLPDEQQRHNSLLRELKNIMATEAEIVEQLKAVTAQLKASNEKIAATNALLLKIGMETDKLKDQIANLPVVGASPELVAALEDIKTTSDAASALADQGAATATTVDEKVPDAPTA